MTIGVSFQILSLLLFIVAVIIFWSNINNDIKSRIRLALVFLVSSSFTGIVALPFLSSAHSLILWCVYLVTAGMQYLFVIDEYKNRD